MSRKSTFLTHFPGLVCGQIVSRLNKTQNTGVLQSFDTQTLATGYACNIRGKSAKIACFMAHHNTLNRQT